MAFARILANMPQWLLNIFLFIYFNNYFKENFFLLFRV
jgi:cytoskeleton-associated protein 5